jgi:hypothetical protein
VARLLHQGLTNIDYEMMALTADAHRMAVAELMRQALEREGQR